jgi:hypothetical protein
MPPFLTTTYAAGADQGGSTHDQPVAGSDEGTDRQSAAIGRQTNQKMTCKCGSVTTPFERCGYCERIEKMAKGRRRAKRKERRAPTPFEMVFPPLRDKKLPKQNTL